MRPNGHPNGNRTDDRTARLTVPEAADVLGISAEAVRSRLARGTLDGTKENGTVYVVLDADRARARTHPNGDQTRPNEAQTPDQTALVDALRDQIEDLRRRLDSAEEANRENRRIIAALTQRIPELQAPASSGPRDARETPAAETEGSNPRPATGGAQEGSERPWWRRMFGL